MKKTTKRKTAKTKTPEKSTKPVAKRAPRNHVNFVLSDAELRLVKKDLNDFITAGGGLPVKLGTYAKHAAMTYAWKASELFHAYKGLTDLSNQVSELKAALAQRTAVIEMQLKDGVSKRAGDVVHLGEVVGTVVATAGQDTIEWAKQPQAMKDRVSPGDSETFGSQDDNMAGEPDEVVVDANVDGED
jgi:hypothetical protein